MAASLRATPGKGPVVTIGLLVVLSAANGYPQSGCCFSQAEKQILWLRLRMTRRRSPRPQLVTGGRSHRAAPPTFRDGRGRASRLVDGEYQSRHAIGAPMFRLLGDTTRAFGVPYSRR